MKFRSAILLSSMTLVIAVVAASVVTVSAAIDSSAHRDLEQELDRSIAVFRELQDYRASLFRAQSDVVAQAPRLKAVVNTADIDHATVLDTARELQRSATADLLLLTDWSAHLWVDTADPSAQGFDLGDMPLISTALEEGLADGIWVVDDGAYQVQAQTLNYGRELVGIIVLGFVIDERVASTIERQTGASVVITLDERVIAMSAKAPFSDLNSTSNSTADAEPNAALLSLAARPSDQSQRVVLGGSTYLARSGIFPGARADQGLGFIVLRSLDQALADSRAIMHRLLWIAGFALLAAIALAILIARRLARPLDQLVDFTAAIATGDLRPRDFDKGTDEVRSLSLAMNNMVHELAESRVQLAAKQRLENEMEIAAQIQTSIIPEKPAVPELEIAAVMRTASEVGGDYYDVIATDDGAWIGVGDVAGHGLRAGLVMLMVQSAISSLVRERPNAPPRELVATLNRVIYDNVRERLAQDEHVTFTLFRYSRGGVLRFAGAHEPFLVLRAQTGLCEQIETPGTWIGVLPNIDDALSDSTLDLEIGDIVLLYSDGLVESRNQQGEFFGLDRVRKALISGGDQPLESLAQTLVQTSADFGDEVEDDISILLFKVTGKNSSLN